VNADRLGRFIATVILATCALLTVSVVILAALTGCTVDGKAEDAWHGAIRDCIDLRDGERFSFDPRTIRNQRFGINAPSSVDFTDLDGRERTVSTDMVWIKCQPRPALKAQIINHP
jgi:hypothetical protein